MVAIGLKKAPIPIFGIGAFQVLEHPPKNRGFLLYTGHSLRVSGAPGASPFCLLFYSRWLRLMFNRAAIIFIPRCSIKINLESAPLAAFATIAAAASAADSR